MDTNVFSCARVGWLLRKYIRENRSMIRFSGLFVILFMLMTAMINGLAFMHDSDFEKEINEEITFMIISFLLIGCVLGASSFNDMNDKKKLTCMLMTPVSALEQFIVRWIIYVPGYLLLTLLCVMLSDMVKYVTFNFIFDGEVTMLPWGDFFSTDFMDLYFILLTFMFMQSFFILGSVVWRKKNFIKTFYFMLALFILYVIPVAVVYESYADRVRSVSVTGDILAYIPVQLLLWITVTVNYTITVMRLKESEIIHRW